MSGARPRRTSNRLGTRSAGTCVAGVALGLAVFGVFRAVGDGTSLGRFDGALGADESAVFAALQTVAPQQPRVARRPPVPRRIRARPALNERGRSRPTADVSRRPSPALPLRPAHGAPLRGGDDVVTAAPRAAQADGAASPAATSVPLVDLPAPLPDPAPLQPAAPLPLQQLSEPPSPESLPLQLEPDVSVGDPVLP